MRSQPPAYVMDYDSIARLPDPLAAVIFLHDFLDTHPEFYRDFYCRTCEHWSPKEGSLTRPIRPFAPDPLSSCHGCALSMLDEDSSHGDRLPLHARLAAAEAQLEALESAEGTWARGRVESLRGAVSCLREQIEERAQRWAARVRPGVRMERYTYENGKRKVEAL